MKCGKKLYNYAGGILCIALALLIFSCSGDRVVQSDSQLIADDLGAINAVDLARSFAPGQTGLAKTEGGAYLVSQVQVGFEINGSSYATSFVLDSETISIKVPGSNFDKSRWGDRLYIYIRAEKWNTPTGVVYYYDCNPGGVIFTSALMLIQPFKNNLRGIQNLYWKNESLNQWVVADTQELSSGYVKFDIGHFSKYAIAD